MLFKNKIKDMAYEYVINMKHGYNPQIIANRKYLNSLKKDYVLNILDLSVETFCKTYKPFKVRDFVYKNDYFTPRNMYLINPLYYLYYTYLVFLITKEYFGKNEINFSKKNMSIFYSGYLNFGFSKIQIRKNVMYYSSYKRFQKVLRRYRGKPALKIDIKDFFNSIKVNELITKLRNMLGDIKYVNDLKVFFEYCEIDSLPQFHFSIASSILSQFYLTDFDSKLQRLLINDNLQLIRYVDDMYILFLDGIEDNKKANELLNEISFYLWEDLLVLNSSKTEFLSASQFNLISDTLKDSYEENYYNKFSSSSIIENHAINIIEAGKLNFVVETLCDIEKYHGIDLQLYRKLMEEHISINGGEVNKVLNNILFSEKWKVLSETDLLKLVENWKYIYFNPYHFTILYLKIYRYLEKKGVINNDGQKIRRILNHLFKNDRFTLRDTLIAVTYLFQSNLKHRDLINKIREVNPDYVNFIQCFIIDTEFESIKVMNSNSSKSTINN